MSSTRTLAVRPVANWLGQLLSRNALVRSGVPLVLGGIGSAILGSSVWWGLTLIVFAGLAQAAIGAWDAERDNSSDIADAQDRMLVEIIAPLLDRATATATQPMMLRESEVQAAAAVVVTRLVSALSNVAGVRAVVFLVSDDEQEIRPVRREGRQQAPGPFMRGTARGDKAFQILRDQQANGRYVFVPDLGVAPQGSGSGRATATRRLSPPQFPTGNRRRMAC